MRKKIFCAIVAYVIFANIFISNSRSEEIYPVYSRFPDLAVEFTGYDKWESFNRKIFTFNLNANKYVIKPLNIAWASVMPKYGMDRIQNFYDNVNYPVRLFGCLFQKDYSASKQETKRFFINSTVGFVGLYDVARTKYNLEPRGEDMGQVLAYHRVKQGPYLVLPLVAQGNLRDIAGSALDLPFSPTSYIVGPISAISTGVSLMNDTTFMQPIAKMMDNYADPYDASKKLNGLEKYIKNNNLDRSDVFKQISNSQKDSSTNVNINNLSLKTGLNSDITLDNFDPQGRWTDALRTIRFDNKKIDTSVWSDLSIWNKTFEKRIKTDSVSVFPNRAKYSYRYILQKYKNSPLAIIYPSIGESANSVESVEQAKILYDAGYSVLILGSAFQWEFVKSMPDGYCPGLPYQDAYYLRESTAKALRDLAKKNNGTFGRKIVVGTSFGGLTALFAASQEEKQNMLGVSHYLVINPPIELFYALKQLDDNTQKYVGTEHEMRVEAAVTTQKVINASQMVLSGIERTEKLPFNEKDAKLAVGYAMNQKLSDVIFTIEHGNPAKKSSLYGLIRSMNFYDYANRYLISRQKAPLEQLEFDSSMYPLSDFLKTSNNYKIYHTLDDCFVNSKQLFWLKMQTKNKSVIFSNGSHLGYLYRKEFLEQFRKDIEQDRL